MNSSVKKITTAMALSGCVAFMGRSVNAAIDGPVGTANSAGTVDISVTIPTLIRIHGLSDILFTFDPGVTEAQEIDFCVSGNNAAGTYTAVLTSGEGAFQLDNLGAKLPYHAEFDGSTAAAGTGDETYNTATASFGLNGELGNCVTPNASLNVYVSAADLNGVGAGTYTDTMTITVTPD